LSGILSSRRWFRRGRGRAGAILTGERPVVRLAALVDRASVGRSPGEPLGDLPPAPPVQGGDGDAIQVDDPVFGFLRYWPTSFTVIAERPYDRERTRRGEACGRSVDVRTDRG